jgi:hypothetical protein
MSNAYENNLIYALYCPINNIPVYVGKSTMGLDRPFTHIKEQSHNEKVNEWVAALKKDGKQPTLVILENSFDAQYINEKEQFWITKFLQQGKPLLNVAGINAAYFNLIVDHQERDEEDDLADIRLFIKTKRKMFNLSQQDLADKSGVGIRFIRELEQGKKKTFRVDKIQDILWLFGGKLTVRSHKKLE